MKVNKVGRKYNVVLNIKIREVNCETTIWGDTPEEATRKAEKFIEGHEEFTNDNHE